MPSSRIAALLLSFTAAAVALPAQAAEHRKPHRAPAKKTAPATPRDKPGHAFGPREDLMRYAAELAAAQGWDSAELQRQLAQAQSLPVVQRLIMPAASGAAKDWAAYRARFVEPRRVQAGLAFWAENEEALARAEQRFGVPAEVMVGLIGVETFYGRIMGDFRVVDALATLAFDFPSGRSDRSEFFRGELTEFLKLCRREQLDPLSVKGSYAGAMGLPQFMPGSWNRYAIDFNGDGHVDLVAEPADAIGSVANYLVEHGWKRGMPVSYAVSAPSTGMPAQLLQPDIKPTFSGAELQAAGLVVPEAAREHLGPMAVVELQNGPIVRPSYVLGTENFYTLTRYNWSAYYAMAVVELGRTLAALRAAQ